MDTELIETLLIELLQLERERFTPEKVLANLTLAATAAGVSLSSRRASLQREHMLLKATLDHMRKDLGDQYRVRAVLRLGDGLEGVELGAIVEPHTSTSPLPRFVAFGSTARTCVATLKRDIASTQQSTPAPMPGRRSGTLPLQRLASQLAATSKDVA
ncbi:hypothetical protein SAMN05216588_12451 [Pseudomonas flavescens]|uniref:Uncharacterized protein n=1 Tax=Phytopseudomonas flavescens TaxID=29435 RepID=A0A1G8NB52_9GAMM|nr:hypothetical protein [Pseudomonas flavescens]SDI77363.1 hypothetical protein SAMN05216588_12451 [Pseudomonas flavescens]